MTRGFHLTNHPRLVPHSFSLASPAAFARRTFHIVSSLEEGWFILLVSFKGSATRSGVFTIKLQRPSTIGKSVYCSKNTLDLSTKQFPPLINFLLVWKHSWSGFEGINEILFHVMIPNQESQSRALVDVSSILEDASKRPAVQRFLWAQDISNSIHAVYQEVERTIVVFNVCSLWICGSLTFSVLLPSRWSGTLIYMPCRRRAICRGSVNASRFCRN